MQWVRSRFRADFSAILYYSYSATKIRVLLNSMNLPYSAEQIEEIKEDLYLKAKEGKTKELAENVFAVFIDAYHTSIDTNRVQKAVIYKVIGIYIWKAKRDYTATIFSLVLRAKMTGFRLINRRLKRGMLMV